MSSTPGDFFLCTYSGHGGQVRDKNHEEESDRSDETWVLYDRQLVDDELYALWATFKPGVRVVILSDSCHSGSVTKEHRRGRPGRRRDGRDRRHAVAALPRDCQGTR